MLGVRRQDLRRSGIRSGTAAMCDTGIWPREGCERARVGLHGYDERDMYRKVASCRHGIGRLGVSDGGEQERADSMSFGGIAQTAALSVRNEGEDL